MMRLRQTRCQLLWTWATHYEYSQAGEKAVRARSTRSTGEELEVDSVLAWMRACGRCRAAAAAAEARQGRARQATLLPLRACEEFVSKSKKQKKHTQKLYWSTFNYLLEKQDLSKLHFTDKKVEKLCFEIYTANLRGAQVPLAHMWFSNSFQPTSHANVCTYFST